MTRKGGVQPHETPPEVQAEIVRLLHSGLTMPAIARQLNIGKTCVYNCARRNGITNYALGTTGRPMGSMSKSKPVKAVKLTIVSPENEWRARAASLRWGYGLGGGW